MLWVRCAGIVPKLVDLLMEKKKSKLTAAALATLPTGEYVDTLLPGLNLSVGARRKTWSLRYRVGGKQRRTVLGHHPKMGLAEARQAARDANEALDKGAPVQLMQAHPRTVETVTLGDALAKYERMRTRKGDKIKSLPEAMRVMRKNFGKHLDQPAKDFDRAKMRELRDEIDARAPIMALRFHGYCGPFFSWAEDEEIVEVSPLYKVRKLAMERKRDRVLSDEEMRSIWWACDSLNSDSGKAFGRMTRFLLATAQRKMEAGELRYRSLLGGYWKQRAEENKSGREHRVLLPGLALDQIGRGSPGDLVFGSASGAVITNFDKLKKELHRISGTSGWSLHDLRRSAASKMAELGVARDTIDGVLNHSISGVAAHYIHADLEKQKGDALEKWDAELRRIIGKKSATAVAS